MFWLTDGLALARKKVIKARKRGLSFNPKKNVKVPLVGGAGEWKTDSFKEFRKKVEQSKVVIFTVLPGMDEPEVPQAMIITSLWGEVLVSGVDDLMDSDRVEHEAVGDRMEVQEFFNQSGVAYISEREDQTLRYMTRLGISLDEATLTGLETWHRLSQGFCPSVGLVFEHLWVRLAASFRGTSSSDGRGT